MSLFSAYILPRLQKELKVIEPEIAGYIVDKIKSLDNEIIEWAEKQFLGINVDNEENAAGVEKDD
jgi:aspartate ammonia-lyase